MTCTKCGNEIYWYTATNERGWRCCSCGHQPGEPPGYDPQRDRDDINGKVHSLIHDLYNAGFVHVSNGSAGDGLAAVIADQCMELEMYDQTTICRLIFEANRGHAEYWKRISDGVRSGNDPRDRCKCGALATGWSGSHWYCSAPACRELPAEAPF